MGQMITEIADLLTVFFRFEHRNDMSEKCNDQSILYLHWLYWPIHLISKPIYVQHQA
jgi:hypothetical protein